MSMVTFVLAHEHVSLTSHEAGQTYKWKNKRIENKCTSLMQNCPLKSDV
jgi:hypothetical protein